MRTAPFSWRRAGALIAKEFRQIARDPSSILLSVVLPLVMIFLYGYGLNLDSTVMRTGVLLEDDGADGRRFVERLSGSPFFAVETLTGRGEMADRLERGDIRAAVVVPSDFSARVRSGRPAGVQLATDATDPNTAIFAMNYLREIVGTWAAERGLAPHAGVEIVPNFRFNPAAVSRHYLIPGSMSLIVSMVGALLTSLVIAREWERGTMEALLASAATRGEFLLSKTVPYFALGMVSMGVCTFVAVVVMGVPMRSPLIWVAGMTALFLLSALGIGLLISTTLKNQFSAAQIALETAVLPNILLSGFLFEIASMPWVIRMLSHFVPARYFVNALQTLFQAGPIRSVMLVNVGFLLVSGLFWMGLAVWKTNRRLDG